MRGQPWSTAALAAVMLLAAMQYSVAKKAHRHGSDPASSAPSTQSPPPTPQSGSTAPAAPPTAPPSSVSPGSPSNPANAEPSAIVVDKQDVQSILGKSVRSSAGEDMGRLIDVVVDREGQTRAAIIDFGGFLGVGSRKIAVDWKALQFSPDDPKGNTITLALTRDQVKAAPEFKDGTPVVILGTSGDLQTVPFPRTPEK
jgi:sporulation protein YlmC with PRC-barrel domain